jgi:formate dehydrogenase subunit gamma
MQGTAPVAYQRWNWQHRLQHMALFLSMFGLLSTGLAIKFHHTAWAQGLFRLLGGFRQNVILHKASATFLVLVALWHLAYLLWHWRRERSGPWQWAMMPRWKDFQDAYHHALYLLNLRADPPRYDRYSYLEKFEYLAIFWGMVVMGLTGFSLWFPTVAARYVPRMWLDAFRIIHGNEAVVAVITLAYGHFFTAHLNPAVFPSNPVWFTGRISLEHLMEEHPLEYQRLVEQGALPAVTAPAHPHRLTGWRRALAAVELVIYSAIFYYLLITFLPMLLA